MGSTLNSSKMAFGWYQTRWRYGKVKMSESQKWDWKLIGKAESLVITIISRIREVMGEATLAWEMMEWLAKEAPKELYVKVWSDIISAWQVSEEEKKVREKMSHLEWIEVSLKPDTYKEAFEYFGPASGGFRFPTCQELVFAINEKMIIPKGWIWVEYPNAGTLLAFSLETMGLVEVGCQTRCYAYGVRRTKRVDSRWLCPTCRKKVDELRALGKIRWVQGYQQCTDCHADICSPGEAGPGNWTGLIKNR
jgi:hypothetical protein